mmetsp:Transcript_93079/g.289679  ORF Transcript_93079/g.289679 Transcript_93079/m.289679 type:complete len:447 (+) Transcript_93079:147-1487(+)
MLGVGREGAAPADSGAGPYDHGGLGSRRGRLRLYTRWPGKSRFVCGGRCVTGGEDECPVALLGGISCANVATWLCVLVPSALYFAVALPHATRHWNPRPPPLLPVASVGLFAVTVGFLLATSCSDPGIIPRRSLVLATGTRARVTALLGHDLLGTAGLEPSGDALDDAERMVPPGLRQRGYRWCHTCEIVRPPRASHCRDCDHCVLRFDHHCPFVNNCIGQRNYHFFIGFTTAAMLLAAIVIPALMWSVCSVRAPATVANSGEEAVPFGGPGDGSVVAVAWLRLAAIVGCLSLAGVAVLLALLWLYHLWLVLRGQTTKEHWTRRQRHLDVSSEPTLCAPRGPRLFDPRAWIDPDALAEGGRGALATASFASAASSDAAVAAWPPVPAGEAYRALAGFRADGAIRLPRRLQALPGARPPPASPGPGGSSGEAGAGPAPLEDSEFIDV